MDPVTIGSFVFGVVVRLGIPLGITILLIRWLGHLDVRWQNEARRDAQLLTSRAQVSNRGCWDVWHCTAEQKSKCPAFAHKEIPCWQVFRQKDGLLKEKCFGCSVFKTAPVPVL